MSRKLKRVRISYEFFNGFALAGARTIRVISEIPETAQAVGASVDQERGLIQILYEDNSFPEIGEGEKIPLAANPVITVEKKVP